MNILGGNKKNICEDEDTFDSMQNDGRKWFQTVRNVRPPISEAYQPKEKWNARKQSFCENKVKERKKFETRKAELDAKNRSGLYRQKFTG